MLNELRRYLAGIEYLGDKEYLERAMCYAKTLIPELDRDTLGCLNILCMCTDREYVQAIRNLYLC